MSCCAWPHLWIIRRRGSVLSTENVRSTRDWAIVSITARGNNKTTRWWSSEIKKRKKGKERRFEMCRQHHNLVVFFVVCPRVRPFWSVFGELALVWCQIKIALTRRKRFKTTWDAPGKQQRIQQGNKVSRFYLKTYHFFSLLRKTFVNIRL